MDSVPSTEVFVGFGFVSQCSVDNCYKLQVDITSIRLVKAKGNFVIQN